MTWARLSFAIMLHEKPYARLFDNISAENQYSCADLRGQSPL